MNIVNDKVTDYINSFYKPLNSELNDLRMEAEENKVPIIMRDAESAILNFIRIKKPLKILEIGAAVGYSAACFANVAKDAEIISLELDEQMFETASSNINKFGLSNRVSFILGDACASMENLKETIKDASNDGFDMVFIDAAKSHYKEFWDYSIQLCKKDAVIISDNVLLKARTASDDYVTEKRHKTNIKRMREYLEYITNLDYADTSILSVGDGLSVSVLKL